MDLRTFFFRHPVFTKADLVNHLAGQGERSPRAIESLLVYHVRVGHLVRIRRGLYASVRPGTRPESHRVDHYLLAAKLAPDAVVGYHAALEFLGPAYSVHFQTLVLSSHKVRPLRFQGETYRVVPHPKTLRDKGQERTGIKVHYPGGDMTVHVTTLERTLVDVLDRPDLAGGWEEVWRSIDAIYCLNLEAVVDYALLLDNATVAAKVGHFLELRQEELFVDDRVLERLHAHRPKRPHYFQRRLRRPTRLIKRWNLLVPEELATTEWVREVL